MRLDAIPVRNEDLAVRELEGELFVMQPTTSELHALNGVGARVWELLDGRRSVSDVISQMEAEYDVSPDALQADVLEFLDALSAKELISE